VPTPALLPAREMPPVVPPMGRDVRPAGAYVVVGCTLAEAGTAFRGLALVRALTVGAEKVGVELLCVGVVCVGLDLV